jgi:hypothetical protein
MTPKEKANILIFKFLDFSKNITKKEAKKFALIVVDEILNERSFLISIPLQDVKYWEEVKQEILNL